MQEQNSISVKLYAERQQIHNVLLNYCRGIDRLDRELVRSCYHPDASDEHGSFKGGVEAYLDWCWRLLDKYEMTMHYLSNCHIEVDGRRALAESYGVAMHQGKTDIAEHNLCTGFRFIDIFENRDGHWKILRRTATTEWVRQLTASKEWPIADHLRRGSRDRHDPVYQDWREDQAD